METITNRSNFPEDRKGLDPTTRTAIITLPVFLVGWVWHWVTFRKLRYKPSFSDLLAIPLITVTSLVSVTLWRGYVTSDKPSWSDWIIQVTLPLLVTCLPVGLIVGCVFNHITKFQLLKNPSRVKTEGLWSYKFTFRKSPLDKRRLQKKVQQLQNGSLLKDNQVPVGLDCDTDQVIYRYPEEAGQHTAIVGATGSGKTAIMSNLIYADLLANRTTVIVDFKASSDLAYKVSHWCELFNLDFYHFTGVKEYRYPYGEQCTYDPLNSGTATSKAGRILNMREYAPGAEVYKSNDLQLLQVLMTAIEQADKHKGGNINFDQPTLLVLDDVLDGKLDTLQELCLDKPIAYNLQQLINASKNPRSHVAGSVTELQSQIRTITSSTYSPWLHSYPGEVKHIQLEHLLNQEGKVILFSFNSNEEPDFAKFMGSLVLSDITAVSGERFAQGSVNRVALYCDEFQSVNPNTIEALLEKGREAKVGVTLGLPSLEQIVKNTVNNGEATLGALLDTIANFFVCAGCKRSSAEQFSALLGEKEETVYSATDRHKATFLSFNWFNRREQIINRSTRTVPILPYSDIMSCVAPNEDNGYRSEAYLIKKSPRGNSRAHGAFHCKLWNVLNKEATTPSPVYSSLPVRAEHKFITPVKTVTEDELFTLVDSPVEDDLTSLPVLVKSIEPGDKLEDFNLPDLPDSLLDNLER